MKPSKTKEPFYKSRRIWAAGLTLVTTIVITIAPEQYEVMKPIVLLVASILGLRSFTFPKK